MEALGSGNLNLQFFELIFFELKDFSAFGANHVIMMLPQVSVFVADLTIVELAPIRKTETAQ
jgi:hypothetical protein